MTTDRNTPTRILVVDDEPDLEVLIRQRYRKKIRAEEYEILFAANGVEALKIIEEDHTLELLLTDINMPEMDGLTLLGKVKDINPMLKAVVISAYGDMANIRTAMNLGAFDFLTKPIDLDDLDRTITRTQEEVHQLKRASADRHRLISLEQELNVATRIQQAMLPDVFPEKSEVTLYATMHAAKEIGGDFYDFFSLDENRLGFVLGDVSGKGVPAALLMSMTRILVKSSAQVNLSPAETIAKANAHLCDDTKGNEFVTLFYGVLDISSGLLRFCNAGHPPPYHLTPSSAPAELPLVGGMIIGVNREAEYETGEIQLLPGQSLVLYSDGVTEAMDHAKQQYGESRLLEALALAATNPTERVDQVLTHVRAFCEGSDQSDDITVLALRYG